MGTATGQKHSTLGAPKGSNRKPSEEPPSPPQGACEHRRLHPAELGVNCSDLAGLWVTTQEVLEALLTALSYVILKPEWLHKAHQAPSASARIQIYGVWCVISNTLQVQRAGPWLGKARQRA